MLEQTKKYFGVQVLINFFICKTLHNSQNKCNYGLHLRSFDWNKLMSFQIYRNFSKKKIIVCYLRLPCWKVRCYEMLGVLPVWVFSEYFLLESWILCYLNFGENCSVKRCFKFSSWYYTHILYNSRYCWQTWIVF